MCAWAPPLTRTPPAKHTRADGHFENAPNSLAHCGFAGRWQVTVSNGISRETQGGLHLYGKIHCVSFAPKASKAQNSAYRLSLSTGPWQPKALRHSSPFSFPPRHSTPLHPTPFSSLRAPLNPKPYALAAAAERWQAGGLPQCLLKGLLWPPLRFMTTYRPFSSTKSWISYVFTVSWQEKNWQLYKYVCITSSLLNKKKTQIHKWT